MKPKDRLIVALDVDNEKKALELVSALKGHVKIFKVGSELFSSCGPTVIEKIKEKGCKVFLDLKFHDIPNTVAKAAAAVTKLKPFMFNVHALGGYEMMKAAKEAVDKAASSLRIDRPKVLAVTILTSMDKNDLKKIGVNVNIEPLILKLARLAKDAGLDGVIASPFEVAFIRKRFGKSFLIVTPGVRPSWAPAGDQKRFATPREAVKSGADYIVIGRPIIESANPKDAVKRINPTA